MLAAEKEHTMGEGQHIEETYPVEDRQEKQGLEGEGEAKIAKQQFRGEGEKTKKEKQKFAVCTMCKGKGYWDAEDIAYFKRQEGNQTSCTLPSISRGQQQPPYKVEELFMAEGKVISRMSDSAVVSTVKKPQTRLPPVHMPNSSAGRYPSAGQVKSTPGNYVHTENFLPLPKKFDKHPEDVARLAAIKLNRGDWETKKAGLEECLQLARSFADELEPHMSLVYRALSALMHCHFNQTTVFACQAAGEFFATMRSTCRPEYDELVYSLLGRTADVNKLVRVEANKALDLMVTNILTTHAVRPLVEKGPIHNNPLVRTATARLLTCIVALKTPNIILTMPNLRDTCKKIIETATVLMADNNIDVRAEAKKLISKFMNEDEFESFYYAEVDEKMRKRVHRTFLDIKSKLGLQYSPITYFLPLCRLEYIE